MILAHAYDATRLAWPTDWTTSFGRVAPLHLEIGFGNAQFLVALAQHHPQVNLIGVDLSLPSVKKAERKVKHQRLEQVRIVHGEAKLLLWSALPPASLQAVYINFPDPWPKAAHQQRQLINASFLHLLASRTATGATLDIATDDPNYQEQIAHCLTHTPYFESRLEQVFLTHNPQRWHTKYERKAQREGRVCHYYKWKRNATTAGESFPIPQELEMPHVILHSPLTLEEILGRYEAQRHTAEGVPIRLMRLYHAPHDRALLIETHIVEEPLPQRVGLFIQTRDQPHEYILGLHELGFPRPTLGVHRALAHLARWVVSLDERSTIQHHNLNGGVP